MKVISSALGCLALVALTTAAPTMDSTIIPGRYIIKVAPQVTTEALNAMVYELESAFESEGQQASITHRYDMDGGFKGFAGEFDQAALEALKARENVVDVEPDRKMYISGVQEAPTWGLARVGSDKVSDVDFGKYEYPDKAGEGITAYVIDTGCVPEHDEFEGRATLGKAFGSETSLDGNGHGTHVAGTIAGKTYGVAKKAHIVCVKVLGDDGSGSYSDVIAGIEWAAKDAKDKKAVGNMSLGGRASQMVDDAVEAAIKSGLQFAVAAGNDGGDACRNSPARVKSAVTVAASTKDNEQAKFSSNGECVTLYAPGKDITSAWYNKDIKTISGTSMASPHVAGVLALYLAEDNSLTPEQLKEAVITHGIKDTITNPSKNTANIMAYVFMKKDTTPVDPPKPVDPPVDPPKPVDPPVDPPKDDNPKPPKDQWPFPWPFPFPIDDIPIDW